MKLSFAKRAVSIGALCVGIATSALAYASDPGSNPTFGPGFTFSTTSHTWTPNLNVQMPLTQSFFCGKLNEGKGYSSDNNLVSCQFVGIATAGLSNLGEYLQDIEASNDSDNPSCYRNLRYYGGLGLGMAVNMGPGGVVSFTSACMATVEPNQIPHGVLVLGLSLRFGG